MTKRMNIVLFKIKCSLIVVSRPFMVMWSYPQGLSQDSLFHTLRYRILRLQLRAFSGSSPSKSTTEGVLTLFCRPSPCGVRGGPLPLDETQISGSLTDIRKFPFCHLQIWNLKWFDLLLINNKECLHYRYFPVYSFWILFVVLVGFFKRGGVIKMRVGHLGSWEKLKVHILSILLPKLLSLPNSLCFNNRDTHQNLEELSVTEAPLLCASYFLYFKYLTLTTITLGWSYHLCFIDEEIEIQSSNKCPKSCMT